jgi:hypothetical protein
VAWQREAERWQDTEHAARLLCSATAPAGPPAQAGPPNDSHQPPYSMQHPPDVQRAAPRHPSAALQVAQVVGGVGQGGDHQEAGAEGASVAQVGRDERGADAALKRLQRFGGDEAAGQQRAAVPLGHHIHSECQRLNGLAVEQVGAGAVAGAVAACSADETAAQTGRGGHQTE